MHLMAPQPKANPLPIDNNVQVPEAVRRAAAAADAAMAANNPQPPAEPPAPANNDTITIAPPAPPQQLPGQVPLTIEQAPPPAPPAPAAPQEPQQPVDWENRYNSMHGRFREASNQLQQATSRIEALENMLASVQAAPRAPTPQPSQKFITSKDEEEMGPEMIDFARRVAREEIAPLTSLQQELAELRQQVQGTSQTVQVSARERMHADLDSSMPNWQTVNHDPEFHAWLALQDPLSGVSRKKLVTDAYAQNNSARVLAIFNRFVSETAAYRPASSNPETAPVVPHVGAQPIRPTLEDLAAPGRARTAASPQAPAEKQIIRTSDVNAFYAAVRKGAYRGREGEQAQHEAELHLAMREGRIVQDT
jgi:hypothetical protein